MSDLIKKTVRAAALAICVGGLLLVTGCAGKNRADGSSSPAQGSGCASLVQKVA